MKKVGFSRKILVAAAFILSGCLSFVDSKPTFVEGDEHKVQTGCVMDGPNTIFFANGVFYSTALRHEDFSFPEETTKSFNDCRYFKMPPFDCTIEVFWGYYTSGGANIQISQA